MSVPQTRAKLIVSILTTLGGCAIATWQSWQVVSVLFDYYRGRPHLVEPWWFFDRTLFTLAASYGTFVAVQLLGRRHVWPVIATGLGVFVLFFAVFVFTAATRLLPVPVLLAILLHLGWLFLLLSRGTRSLMLSTDVLGSPLQANV